jgi:hypothetical protein
LWHIEFYKQANGKCPTEEFLDSLDRRSEYPYVENAVRQLEEHGIELGYPHASPLGQSLYELRIKIRDKQYRIFYFFQAGKIIILLNGIIKRSKDKKQQSAISRAYQYMKNYKEINK